MECGHRAKGVYLPGRAVRGKRGRNGSDHCLISRRHLVGASGGPGVKIWDWASRNLLLALPEETGTPWCLAWSPGGDRLAVGSSDGGLVIWDVPRIRSQLADIGLDW